MDQWYRSVISGERAGVMPALLRFVFEIASWFYTIGVEFRNFLFDRGLLRVQRLNVPVISVGNITTGGTGKTPTVIFLVKELQRMGRKPAVLTRGYGAKAGQKPDEVLVIESECPGVPVIVNADRVAGGIDAVNHHHADVLVMDDGFQHRRLHRDLDIVLIDTTEPMGIPGVLPRGTWREQPYNLKRANVIMLTRCEQVTQELADLAASLLTQWVSPRRIFQQYTRITGVFDAQNLPAPITTSVEPKRVLAFAGIGNPNGFLNTVRTLGVNVSAAFWFDDHHAYTPDDFDPLARVTAQRKLDAWITTQKDMVKLLALKTPVPLWSVRIDTQLPPVQLEAFRTRLIELLSTRPAVK